MKKFVLTTLVTVVSVVAITGAVFSQRALHAVNSMHETSIPTGEAFASVVTVGNLKAMKHFRKSYGQASDEKWFRLSNGYLAQFLADDVRFRVEYNLKGRWTGTEKGYAGRKLDAGVRTVIQNTYKDYEIKWVKEIIVPDALVGPVYFINIESVNSIKHVCLHNGELKVMDEYRKKG